MEIDEEKLELMKQYLSEFRQDLADSLAKQVAASQLKTKYLDVLSHQTRTPLSGMRMSMELLLSGAMGELTPEVEETLHNIYDNSDRILQVLNDIFSAQDIEKGNLHVKFVECDLGQLIDETLSKFGKTIKRRKLKIHLEKPDSVPVKTDPEKLKMVLYHLLLNAIRYSKDGSEISVTVTSKGFEIKDQGIGIPKGDKAFIFDRFFRAKNASTMFTDSSGLGLYIAKNYVSELGGDLEFDSTEGKGSAFRVTF